MARAAGEGLEAGFPRLSWGAVIAGALLALAVHVALGLIGGALGFAAEPADSRALGALAGFWGLLTPLVGTALGAWLACRLAAREDEVGTNLHGVMVWCLGLIAGALFLAGSAASSAMAFGNAAGGNAGMVQRMLRDGDTALGATEAAADQAAKRAATAAGGGAMAALCGLLGAFGGAALARSQRQGKGRGLGWRIAIQRTPRGDTGARAGARLEGGRLEEPEPRAGREPPVHHSERAYPPMPEEQVRDVSRTEGPGAPGDPVRH